MTEKEYIEREAAQKVLADDYAYNAAKLLDTVPVADVQEIKHAKWKEIRDAYGQLEGWIHIECGREVKIKENYCPYCGAKMDKECEK